jgi:hypothetical protein
MRRRIREPDSPRDARAGWTSRGGEWDSRNGTHGSRLRIGTPIDLQILRPYHLEFYPSHPPRPFPSPQEGKGRGALRSQRSAISLPLRLSTLGGSVTSHLVLASLISQHRALTGPHCSNPLTVASTENLIVRTRRQRRGLGEIVRVRSRLSNESNETRRIRKEHDVAGGGHGASICEGVPGFVFQN